MDRRLKVYEEQRIINRIGAVASGGGSPVSPVMKGTITITVPAPGAYEHEQTVGVGGMLATTLVLLGIGSHTDADENHESGLDILSMGAKPGIDTITVSISFGTLTSGPIKINYIGVP